MKELLQEGPTLPIQFEFVSQKNITEELSDLSNYFRSKLEDVSRLIYKQENLSNELSHISKQMDEHTAWLHASNSVLQLFNEDLYEEGIDGLVGLQTQLKVLLLLLKLVPYHTKNQRSVLHTNENTPPGTPLPDTPSHDTM